MYEYETSVLLNEPQPLPVSTAKDVGFKVELTAEVTPVWQHPSNTNEQILQLTVSDIYCTNECQHDFASVACSAPKIGVYYFRDQIKTVGSLYLPFLSIYA